MTCYAITNGFVKHTVPSVERAFELLCQPWYRLYYAVEYEDGDYSGTVKRIEKPKTEIK